MQRTEWNTKKIHKYTENQECYRIDEAVKDIDGIKNDSNRKYQASMFIKSCKKKESLIINSKNGVTPNTLECIRVLEEQFENELTKIQAPGTVFEDNMASESGEIDNIITGTEVRYTLKIEKQQERWLR